MPCAPCGRVAAPLRVRLRLVVDGSGGRKTRMLGSALFVLCAATTTASVGGTGGDHGVQSMLDEESPDVFLAKATLQQYLSRVERKDGDGARRLTHPKTLGVIAQVKRRTGTERHNLAPWASADVQLKTFKFTGAR